MWPGSSVSGFYFAHPQSRYFSLGKIDRDQVADYARRKGMTVTEVERWLGPNLNYEPGDTAVDSGSPQTPKPGNRLRIQKIIFELFETFRVRGSSCC